MKAGDAIATVATPIARALNLDCIDPITNEVRPESRCNKWKQELNNLSDAAYDVFWPRAEQQDKEN